MTVNPGVGETSVNAAKPLRGRDGRPFVLIDGFNLSLEKGTGVATYARNLSYSLRDLGCEVGVLYGSAISRKSPKLIQEVMFFDSEATNLSARLQNYRRARGMLSSHLNRAFEVPITGSVITTTFRSRLPHFDSIWNVPGLFQKASDQFNYFGLRNSLRMPRRPDLVHWTYPLPIRVRGVPNVYTLHDLVPLRLPYTTLDRKARYLKLMKWICRTAAHVVTVSENSRKDIIELLGVPPGKVTNTYQAVTLPRKYLDKPEEMVRQEIESTFGLGYRNYFLFFGSVEPKKNLGRLIEGYLASGVDAPLVIVGAQAWKAEQELRFLQVDTLRGQLRAGEYKRPRRKILQLDYATLAMLVTLIRGARAVLFPSLYEGFGLPVLEAMLLGTPVLTSNTSSVPEVAGDAVLSVNPYEAREIAEGIQALDRDEQLRNELSERGRKRAQLFSEAAYRDRLAAVYEKVLANHGA